jgi:hypothetical protein
MQRKLYLLIALFLIQSHAGAWTSVQSTVGSQTTTPYQSSNPTVELKPTRSLDQQAAEECYVYAFAGALEVANANAWKRKDLPQFSAEYLFIRKELAWANEALTKGTDQGIFYFVEGGDVHHAMKLSVEDGLIPQELFHPRVNYGDWNMELLYQDLGVFVKQGLQKMAATPDDAAKAQIKQQVLQQVQGRIAQLSGDEIFQVQNFSWNNRNWTPQKLENAYGIHRNSHIFLMYPKGAWDMGSPWDLRKVITGMAETFQGAFNYSQGTWNQIWRYVVKSIDNGLPVIFSMHWEDSYHVMNVVGYEYDNKNNLVSVKIKNSWGDEYGDKGFAYFGLDDLEKNVTDIWGFQAPE